MLTSFLSSLFFSFPGASAVGMDEWKMKSFPLHSAAWGGRESGQEAEPFPPLLLRAVGQRAGAALTAHLEGLHAGLDDRSKDRFALAGVGKHVGDLVQEAAEDTAV